MTKLLLIAKSVDGGTGEYLQNLLEIKKIAKNIKLEMRLLVLEEPSYRRFKNCTISYFRNKGFYSSNEKYSLNAFHLLHILQEFLWLKNEIDTFRPEVILSVDIHCNLIVEGIKNWFRKPYRTILTTHIDLDETLHHKSSEFVYSVLKTAVRYFYNKADILVGVSKGVSESLQKNFTLSKTVNVVYNGLDIKRGKKRFRNKNNIVITMARLTEQKDHLTLLKTFSLLQKNIPNSELWILGDGPLRKTLESYSKKLKIDKSVIFWGWVKDIKQYLDKADVFVLSSKREGFAYVLIEAMSRGLPVVATDCPYGPAEVLENGKHGILTPVGDITAMKNSIEKLMKNDDVFKAFSEKSLKRSKVFSSNRMSIEYYKLIMTAN